MASPENDIQWAEGAVAGDLSFPSAEQVSGYANGEDYPNGQINAYRRNVARWASIGFASLGALNTIVPTGSIAPLNSNDFTRAPAEVIETRASLTGPTFAMAADGQFLWTLEGDGSSPFTRIRSYVRDDLAAGPVIDQGSLFPNPAFTTRVLAVNGTHFAVVNETTVELYTVDGVAIWQMEHGGFIRDVALDHEAVYFVGDAGTGGFHARKVLFSAGSGLLATTASAWDFDHTAVLRACTTDGSHLYIGGLDGGSGSIRALDAATGAVVWNSITTLTVIAECLKTDGKDLFSVEASGVDILIQRRGTVVATTFGTVPILTTLTITSAVATGGLHLDQEFVALILDNDFVAFTRESLAPAALFAAVTDALTTDGDRWYVADTPDIKSLHHPARQSVWRRIDPSTAKHAPFRWLSVPEVI